MGISRALLIALLLVVSGCTEADPKSNGSSPTTKPTSTSATPKATASSGVTTDFSPPTQRELDRAARTVLRSPSVDFGYDLLLDGKTILDLYGTWKGRPRGWASETELADPDGGTDYVMRTTSIGKDLWMQMAGWPGESRKCWLMMQPGTVPLGINPLIPGTPGPIRMLGNVNAGADGNEVLLASAIAMLPGKMILQLDLDEFQNDRSLTVPAYLLIAEGEITDIRIKGADIAAALPDLPAGAVLELLKQTDIELTYDVGGTSYDVLRPAEEKITRLDEPLSCGG